jgi:hypothetical protein
VRLALKVTASIGFILALSIATSVVVSRHAFVRILLDLTESRIFALADDLGDVFEATIRLGLPLDEMGNGSDILAAALPLDPQVVALAVVGAQGEVLHQTGRAFDWSRPAAQRGEADSKRGNRRKVVDTGDMLVVWSNIHDPLGRTTGHVGIAASSSYRNTLVSNSVGEVLYLSAIVLVIAIALTGVGAAVACRSLSLVLRRISQITGPSEAAAGDPLGGVGAAAFGMLDQVNAELYRFERIMS